MSPWSRDFTRDLSIAEVFDFVESFCNSARRHRHLGGISPTNFKARARIRKPRLH